jgi:hypothetical protein
MMMADEEVDVVGFVQALLDATEDEGGKDRARKFGR